MGVMTTGNINEIAAEPEKGTVVKSRCGSSYYLMSFFVPFTTVTVMYVLSNSPIQDIKVIPCCLVSGLLAGTSGFVLYKACKVIKHKLRPH